MFGYWLNVCSCKESSLESSVCTWYTQSQYQVTLKMWAFRMWWPSSIVCCRLSFPSCLENMKARKAWPLLQTRTETYIYIYLIHFEFPQHLPTSDSWELPGITEEVCTFSICSPDQPLSERRMAEHAGAVPPFDLWVRRTDRPHTCAKVKHWIHRGPPTTKLGESYHESSQSL